MKCRLNKQLPSFTVMELTVVLTVSAILMVAVMYSFYFFNRLYYSFNQQLNASETIYGFEKQLRNDFQEASYITQEGERLRMVYPEKTVLYSFYQDYLVREQASRVDTVYLGLQRLSVEEVQNHDHEPLVKVFNAVFMNREGEAVSLYISREYTSEALLKEINQ